MEESKRIYDRCVSIWKGSRRNKLTLYMFFIDANGEEEGIRITSFRQGRFYGTDKGPLEATRKRIIITPDTLLTDYGVKLHSGFLNELMSN
jgi:hypothetical protein